MTGQLIDPRLVKVRAGERGSGWAIGTCGVLTAHHVIKPFLEGTTESCLVAVDPHRDAVAFDCVVEWHDAERDLALLRVHRPDQRADWSAALAAADRVVLAEPGSDPTPGEVVGYPNAALEQAAAGALSGRMAFDVDVSVPDKAQLWKGISGAAVRDAAHHRILGVITDAETGRQQRRLYTSVLPNPAADPALHAALSAVGQQAVLEAPEAPTNRELLSLLAPTGRPWTARAVPELGDLGTRRSRRDIDTRGNPYYPYIARDIDDELRAALDRRVAGGERRALVLVGEAMAGKTRTLAAALHAHDPLGDWPLLRPHQSAPLRRVVGGGRSRAVIWLDDVTGYTNGLDEALRALLATPDRVLLATLRTDELRLLQERPEMRSTWDVLTDDTVVEQLTLPSEWSEHEQAALADRELVIREAVSDGHPLGQALGAADELVKKLAAGSPLQHAVATAVIDWPRTGVPAPVTDELLHDLWPSYLSPAQARRAASMPAEQRRGAVKDALHWACSSVTANADPFAAAPAILRRTDAGLVAEAYLVANRTSSSAEIPAAVWDLALRDGQRDGRPGNQHALHGCL